MIVAAWQRLSRDERAVAIAKTIQAIRAPLPKNAEHGHPAWHRDHASPTLRVWSQRAVWGRAGSLPAVRNRIPRTAAALAELDVATLQAAMTALGAVALIHIALDVGTVAVASLATRVATGQAGLIAALNAPVADPRVRSSLGSVRAVAAVVRGCDLAQPDALASIGVRIIAPHVIGTIGTQITMRLAPAFAPELHEFSSQPSLPWLGVVTALAASSPWWLNLSLVRK